jgi:hypothetical protein
MILQYRPEYRAEGRIFRAVTRVQGSQRLHILVCFALR